ncbi:glycosyltransferase family 4 protein [Ekhidna sp.]|uniref:glycosyltransferase family 4 protein n=1 Tax=Ekhidna sp. TaxID=2608089 RepID=UPI00329A4EDB
MKIAFVANTCWNIYNFRKGLVHHFLSKGDEVIVLAPKDEYTDRIKSWGVKWLDTPLEGTGVNPFREFKYLLRIYSIFKSERPAVALSYTIKPNIYSSLASKWTSTKVICNVSGLGTIFLTTGSVGKLALILYRKAFKFSSYVFFQNSDDRELFTSKIKVESHKIGLLPGSGINLKQFKPLAFTQNTKTKFLMISRLIIEKGVREYAEAAKSFKDDKNVDFTLVGKFDTNHSRSIDEKELKQWITNKWIQYHPHSDNISNLIESHDVIVLPSYREGTPRTLLEGAAHARPLLASDVPGCREVVKDGYNGFLFEPLSPSSLINKMKLFLSLSKDEKKHLANNSRKLVEKNFDEKLIVDAYEDAIHRIIKVS